MGDNRNLHEWAESLSWNHIDEDDYDEMDEHEYVVSDWYVGENLEMFNKFREYIEQNGDVESYNGKQFQKVEVNGYKYWVTSSYYSDGLCLNRTEE